MPPVEDEDDDVFEENEDGSESAKPKRTALDILRGRKEGIMMGSESFTRDPISGDTAGIRWLFPKTLIKPTSKKHGWLD